MSTSIKNTPILFIKSSNQDVLVEVVKVVKNVLLSTLDESHVDNIINKIKNNKYIDFVRLNGNEITKEQILDLQEKCFSLDISGDGYKFYLIDNLEKTNKFIQNSLLKFIEEPPLNTYAFFSTNNIDKLLPTITSRCKLENVVNNKECNVTDKSHELNNVIGVYNTYHSLFYLQDTKHFIDEFKKLNYKEIEEFLNKLINDENFTQTDQVLELLNDIKLNLNKNLLIFKLLKMKGL